MANLAWGDTLCGKVITPEDWVGGIIEGIDIWFKGEWRRILDYAPWVSNAIQTRRSESGICRGWCRPIFPPKGWAGLTDAELWFAIGMHHGYHGTECPMQLISLDADRGQNGRLIDRRGGLWVNPNGEIDLQCLSGISSRALLDDPAALQLAIGNALVLHARLTEVQDAN